MNISALSFHGLFFIFFASLAITSVFAATPLNDCQKYNDAADYDQALPICINSAERGDALSQSILGEMYDQGLGVSPDPEKSAFWWTKAADQQNLNALNQLALKYYYGGDVFGPQAGWKQDYPQAKKLWLKDALGGNPASQYMLGIMSFQGQGGKVDYVDAHAWFTLALKGGYKLATDSLIELSRVISQSQKLLAQKRLQELQQQLSNHSG